MLPHQMLMNPFYYALLLIPIFLLTSTADAATSSAAAAAKASAVQQKEVHQFLGSQNAARSALRLPPLVWDVKIARYAAGYAAQRRGDCELKHSNGPFGENIFWGSGNRWTPAQAAAAWVSERRGYNYWSNTCAYGQDCGHYTQIVWRGTRRVGCARVLCYGGRGVFMICNYDPPGNFIGEKPY